MAINLPRSYGWLLKPNPRRWLTPRRWVKGDVKYIHRPRERAERRIWVYHRSQLANALQVAGTLVRGGWRHRIGLAPWYVYLVLLAAWSYRYGVPSWYAVRAGTAGTLLLALPWYRYRLVRRGVPVHLEDVPCRTKWYAVRTPRWYAVHQARHVVRDWEVHMRNADMVGTQLRAIHFGKWHVALDVCAAHKLGTDEIRKRLGTVERCFDGMRNGARVEPLGERARMARIRLMTGDPHAVPLAPPELGTVPIVPAGTCHFVPVGTFETGTPVLVDVRQHILVAGRTNSGKSTLIQVIMRAATTMPWMAVVAVDMKPGAPELGRWNDKVAFLGRNAEDAAVMLTKLKDGLQARGEIMAARGWQTWHPTPAEPHIMVIVDEAQGITQAELGGELSEVAALLRAYGGSLLLATQYPIVDNLPSTVTQQMSTTIGLRTKNATADRVIFGQDATREGWTPSKLPMNKFLILSDLYDTPLPAKGFYLNSPALAEAVDLAPEPIPVDGATWPGLAAPERLHAVSLHKPGQLHAATPAEHSQVTRSKANRVKVLKALVALGPEAHRSAIEDATGLDQKTVDTHLKALAEEGTATKVRRGVWRSAA